ncbi:DUF1559 domain-containing protein [Planctomicrobium sp. SH527]|uniref:DUF1559 domain-containing protein n=1 Tax=Planctomicrobium sp. SH527 TaxID=3448123 RepID=UPI003F5B2CA6
MPAPRLKVVDANAGLKCFGKDSIINMSRPILGCQKSSKRRGLTILELLVTSGILSILIALLLPAVMTAREAARRVECTNHLRQIGLALHNYHDIHACLPAAWQHDPTGQSAYGWAVSLLPFLDHRATFDTINRGLPLKDHYDEIRITSLSLFLCPSDVAPALFELTTPSSGAPYMTLPSANYVGVYGISEPDEIHPTPPGEGAFINGRPVRFSELTRGLSNTFIVGERSISFFPATWIGFDHRDEDAECRVVGSAIEAPNCQQCDECEFGSRHTGVSGFLFGDGHVRGISNSVNSTLYQQMARRHQ